MNRKIVLSIIAMTLMTGAFRGCGYILDDDGNNIDPMPYEETDDLTQADRESESDENPEEDDFDYSDPLMSYMMTDIYYSEIVSFTTGTNDYSAMLEADTNSITMIVDLDNDGLNEAIVCGVDTSGRVTSLPVFMEDINKRNSNQKYYQINYAYFINDNNEIEPIDLVYGESLLQEQCLVVKDDMSYLTMNGYYVTSPYGQMLTVVDDKLVNVTQDLYPVGHKYFSTENELVWYKSYYGESLQCVAGESYNDVLESGRGSGLVSIPYFYSVDGTNIEGYGMKVLTEAEVEEIARFDYSEIDDYSAIDENSEIQFLLCDNGKLYVNVAFGGRDYAYFRCREYAKGSVKWVINGLYFGTCLENPLEPGTWDYMTKVHQ